MPQFKFRLATLLQLREAARDERRAEMAQAQRADDLLRQRQSALEQELSQLNGEQRQRSSQGTLNIDWLMDAQRYRNGAHLEQQAISADRQVVAAEIEKRRQTLMEADREVRVLEKLREVQQERQRIADERQAMKQIDEVANRLAYSATVQQAGLHRAASHEDSRAEESAAP